MCDTENIGGSTLCKVGSNKILGSEVPKASMVPGKCLFSVKIPTLCCAHGVVFPDRVNILGGAIGMRVFFFHRTWCPSGRRSNFEWHSNPKIYICRDFIAVGPPPQPQQSCQSPHLHRIVSRSSDIQTKRTREKPNLLCMTKKPPLVKSATLPPWSLNGSNLSPPPPCLHSCA